MTAVLPDTEKHTMHLTDKTGDTPISWDPNNPDEVGVAEAAFKAAKAKGMLIYKTDRHGSRAEQMRTFDPTAEKIVCVRQYQGG